MKQTIFREFSIRGQAERDLPDDVVERMGQAIGTLFRQDKHVSLILGYDVRQSSPRINAALIEGITATGVDVLAIGLVPTPVLNFAVDHFQASGGVMITASHNPPQDNGLKLRSDVTWTGDRLQQIYRLATNQQFATGAGKVTQADGLTPYLAALGQRLEPGKTKTILIDGGNGINGRVMTDFLRNNGHTVIELFTQPDGSFPNRNPDPTGPDALSAAAEAVVAHQADFGLAYDGDGDRVALIDETGKGHYGDIILMLLARHALRDAPIDVVYDVSCTKALADDVVAHGGQAHPTAVGYAFIHEKMRDIGATLGGETAGHIFCLDDQFQFDDALLASVKLLNYVNRQGWPVSALTGDLPTYFTSPNLRIFCPDNLKKQLIDIITAHYQTNYPVETIDGAKVSFPKGWALVRQSNTQPAISLRAEGETAADLAAIQADVEAQVKWELKKLGVSEQDAH